MMDPKMAVNPKEIVEEIRKDFGPKEEETEQPEAA